MNTIDEKYIRQCIKLSELSFENGDLPFGSVITIDDKIISESTNIAHTTGNAIDHAEIIAMRKALQNLGTKKLLNCTIYSNYEPCPMCSFMIRELGLKRVVFSMLSLDMGGLTRWPILQDKQISEKFPHHFPNIPEVVSGVLAEEASVIWAIREEKKKTK